MKKLLLLNLCLISLTGGIQAQSPSGRYDSALARKLGADDYGMKMYVFVILKTGSVKMTDKKAEDSLFAAHLNNISRLAAEGKLVLAGPFGKNDDNYRGLFIFNETDLHEVSRLLETDPAVRAKLLEPVMYPWYGTASLMEIPELHQAIQKTRF